MKKIIEIWMSFVIARPATVIMLSLIFCSLFFVGLPNFKVSSSPREYIGEDNPLLKHLVQLEEEYIENYNIFVMFMPDDGNVFSRETLSAIEFFTQSAWTMPRVIRVDSLSNFQHTAVDADDLVISDLVFDAENLSLKEIENIKTAALDEPALVNLFVSESGHATAINMTFHLDHRQPAQLIELNDALVKLQDEFATQYPNIQMYETGFANMVYHWNNAVDTDVKKVFSIALVAILAGLIYFLGNVRTAVSVFIIGSLSVVTGLGLVGLLGVKLNGGTILSTLMVMILGLADGIHITKTARRQLTEGKSYKEAIKESIVINMTPVFVTSITTTIGFLTFNLSGFEGIEVMGNYVAFGVMMAFVLSVTMLPAMLCFCGLTPEKKSFDVSRLVSNFVVRHNIKLVVITVPLLLVAIYCASLSTLDERSTRYLKSDYYFTVHLDKIQDELTGASTVMYSFDSGEENGVASPEFMRKVDAFVQWSKTQPEVRHVSTYTDTMKRLNQNMHAGDKEFYRLPGNQELAAQYLLLYELSLPFGLDLTNQINLDKSATRVVLTTDDLSIHEGKDLMARNSEWLQKHSPSFDTQGNSDSITGLLVGDKSIRYTLSSSILALVIIGTILLFTFRSFAAGSLCVLSVVSPIIATFGLWGLVVGRIGLPAALAVCMVVGLAVDFSVHFISKFVYARRQLKLDSEPCIHYAMDTVASPILTSTVVLGGGFFLLTMSLFEYPVVIGWLTSICVLFSAFSALLLIPSILLIDKVSVK